MAASAVHENLSREQYVYLARVAEQANRYKEMVSFVDKLVPNSTPTAELTVEERHLLSEAYKNLIEPLRTAWRNLYTIQQKEEGRRNEDKVVLANDYKSKVEAELTQICDGVLKLLESNLLPSASSSESKVYYLKMKGDYHRYLAKFKTGDERKEAAEAAMNSYKSAQEIAESDLSPINTIRLGLALNFAVFYYEILNSCDKASGMAIRAFVEAKAELDHLGDEAYRDRSTHIDIMQLLRDNHTLWSLSDSEDSKKDMNLVVLN